MKIWGYVFRGFLVALAGVYVVEVTDYHMSPKEVVYMLLCFVLLLVSIKLMSLVKKQYTKIAEQLKERKGSEK